MRFPSPLTPVAGRSFTLDPADVALRSTLSDVARLGNRPIVAIFALRAQLLRASRRLSRACGRRCLAAEPHLHRWGVLCSRRDGESADLS
jgi:hypothetical protein